MLTTLQTKVLIAVYVMAIIVVTMDVLVWRV